MSGGAPRRCLLAVLASASALGALPRPASATWSVLAVDARTGRMVIASATCVSQLMLERLPAQGLRELQAVVAPGAGVAAMQGAVDRSRRNHALIRRELERGTDPDRILELLPRDPGRQTRQIAVLDLKGRSAAFSGAGNGRVALARAGEVPGTDIHYSVQGNLLASPAVVENAVRALIAESGTLEDRVMAAMEAADGAGGDRRCSCRTEPRTRAPCRTRHAQVAYLLAVDRKGESLYLDVTEQNIRPEEDANPVVTLRMRYDALPSERPQRSARLSNRTLAPSPTPCCASQPAFTSSADR